LAAYFSPSSRPSFSAHDRNLYGQKIETAEKRGVVCAGVALPGGLGYVFWVAPSRIGWHGGRMNWASILAYVTGTVDQELLLRNEYLAAENRILKARLKGRVRFSDAERARLGEIGHRLGRKVLGGVATVARPDTILAWYRKLVARKFDGSKARRYRCDDLTAIIEDRRGQ
jgi:hypothetical protein